MISSLFLIALILTWASSALFKCFLPQSQHILLDPSRSRVSLLKFWKNTFQINTLEFYKEHRIRPKRRLSLTRFCLMKSWRYIYCFYLLSSLKKSKTKNMPRFFTLLSGWLVMKNIIILVGCNLLPTIY